MYNQNIPSIAANVKKPTKRQAFDLVKELIYKAGDLDDNPRLQADYARLYSYFLPPVPTKAKTPELWVSKAMAKNNARGYLRFLYSDGKRLIATNGHYLHLCPTTLAEGFYNTELEPVGDQGKYPDIDRVIPSVPRQDDWQAVELSSCAVTEGQGAIMNIEVLPGTFLSRSYLMATLNGQTSFSAFQAKPDGPVRIQLDDADLVA